MSDVTQIVVDGPDISVVVAPSDDVTLTVTDTDTQVLAITEESAIIIEDVETQIVAVTDESTVVIEDTEIQVITIGEVGPPGQAGGGGGSSAIATKTTTYLMVTTDGTILADATSAPFTITLPAVPGSGEKHDVKKIDASANIVTVDGNGKNIDGTATISIKYQNTNVEMQYDSAAWRIL